MDRLGFTGAPTQYSLRSRAERLIAAGRVVLAVFFLFAVWLDPTQPEHFAEATHSILLLYLGYALILLVVLWNWDIFGNRSKIVTHIFDLAIFSFIMLITEGPTSPFFAYFVFLLINATVRWQWRGTLWTALAALSAVTFTAWYPVNLFRDPQFEMNRFVIRLSYLSVIAVLLGYMGAHEYTLRSRFKKLAAWPHAIPIELRKFLHEMLEHAADILDAPRMLLIWEEKEEPVLHSALFDSGTFSYQREPFRSAESLVAAPLLNKAFFCSDARMPSPVVLRKTTGILQRWRGIPLSEDVQERFSIGSVLCIPLRGENHEGYLMALDKSSLTSDDLALGEIIAHEATTRLDHFFLLQQLQDTAATEERIRLARDLHDGLLQSLAGSALQLQSIHRLMQDDPRTAMHRLEEVQQLIAAEQRDLRSHIMSLKPSTEEVPATDPGLPVRLEELAKRMKRHHGLIVELKADGIVPDIPSPLAQEIYFLVHESLVNAARHAAASSVQAQISTEDDKVRISVFDNGRGFPFHGCFVLEELLAKNIGPFTIKERVNALGGSLCIDSGPSGTKIDICLPLRKLMR